MTFYIDDFIEDDEEETEGENLDYFVNLKELVDNMEEVENILPDEDDEDLDFDL